MTLLQWTRHIWWCWLWGAMGFITSQHKKVI